MSSTPIFPHLTAPAERHNFLEAIRLVSLGEHFGFPTVTVTVPNVDSTSNTQLPEAVDLANSLVILNPDRKKHLATEPLQTSHEICLKAARFFAAVLHYMIQGPPDLFEGAIPYPCKNRAAFAHTMLANGEETPLDITACARVMKPAVLRMAVEGLIARRKASLEQFDGVGGMGVLYDGLPAELVASLSGSKEEEGEEKIRPLREMLAVFQDRLDE